MTSSIDFFVTVTTTDRYDFILWWLGRLVRASRTLLDVFLRCKTIIDRQSLLFNYVRLLTTIAVFTLLLFFARIADVHGHCIGLGLAPFEIHTETNIIVVRDKFPEYRAAILVCRYADLNRRKRSSMPLRRVIPYRHCFTTANLDHCILFLSYLFLEFFQIFSRPHVRRYDGGRFYNATRSPIRSRSNA